jgi:hypothetical protein
MATTRSMSTRSCPAHAAITPPIERPPTVRAVAESLRRIHDAIGERGELARVAAGERGGHVIREPVLRQPRHDHVGARREQHARERVELRRAVGQAVQQHDHAAGARAVREHERAALRRDCSAILPRAAPRDARAPRRTCVPDGDGVQPPRSQRTQQHDDRQEHQGDDQQGPTRHAVHCREDNPRRDRA